MYVCTYVCMYVCMYVLPKQIFDAPTSAPQFNASYKAGRREPQLGPLETLSRSGGDDLPIGFQRFILGPLETLSRSGGDDLPFGSQRFILGLLETLSRSGGDDRAGLAARVVKIVKDTICCCN